MQFCNFFSKESFLLAGARHGFELSARLLRISLCGVDLSVKEAKHEPQSTRFDKPREQRRPVAR
jgi:hypothetical protein